jgi:hypothetical protein
VSSSSNPLGSEPISFLHVVNPVTTYWDTLTPAILASLPEHAAMASWEEWISRLRESAERNEVGQNPGIKLLEFYEGLNKAREMPVLSVEKAMERSATMRELGAVSEKWMKIWLGQWAF